MTTHGKKHKVALEKVDKRKVYSLKDALTKVKELAHAKFDETVDVCVAVGIDPAKGEQAVRGSVLMPNAIGKKPRIVVFAKAEYAEEAKKAGADYVGGEELIDKIAEGWMDFDYTVATPDIMGKVGKLAKILGPKGLLPNKKVGTVTFEVGNIVSDLKQGRIFFKNDKNAAVHVKIGKVSSTIDGLYQNMAAFIKALSASKPASSKGKFLKKITVSSTMGVGISVNPDETLNV